MKTDFNIMLMHMQEWMTHSKNKSLSFLRHHHEDNEILRDGYIAALKAKAEAAQQIREYYDGWQGPEAEARVRVSWFMKSFLANKAKNLRRRIQLFKDNAETIIDRTVTKPTSSLMLNIFGLNLNDEEKVLVCWKMDLYTTEETMEKLNKSRATLYNRWNILAKQLKEIL